MTFNNGDDDFICLAPIEKTEVATELKRLEANHAGRSKYVKYSGKRRAEISDFASKYVVSTAMNHFRVNTQDPNSKVYPTSRGNTPN